MSFGINRPRLLAAALLVATSLAAACASVTVGSYLHTGASFRDYRTYAWGPADALSTGDPRLDNNDIFARYVRSRVDAELARRGFELVTSMGQPDLLVHFHASLAQKVDIRALESPSVQIDPADAAPFVYDAGTLFVDLVDTRTNRLVWRAWAEGSIEGVLDRQEWLERRVDEAVTRILSRLPVAARAAEN
jgi:hypothetical protein